jgi:hypothetical protein
MQVVSLAPIPVSSLTWRHGAGPWTTTVISKLTFRLEPGEAQLAKRHDPIHPGDVVEDGGSVEAPADMVPKRERVDVTLVGSAFAPGGVPVGSLRTRLRVGSIDKVLRIEATGSGKRAFKSAALGYDHADEEGNGAGYGPVAPFWLQRRRLLGGLSAPDLAEGRGPHQLDEALDLGFFNAAPPDQQLPELAPNAEIDLTNLHPDHPHLCSRLPNVVPQVFVERPGAQRMAVDAPIRGLWIDTRRAIATLTFLAAVLLERPDEAGKIWVAVAGPGRRLSAAGLDKLIGTLRAPPSDGSDGTDDEPTADETGDALMRRTQAIRPRPSSEGTKTSLLSKEHAMERTAHPADQRDPGMPPWMKSPAREDAGETQAEARDEVRGARGASPSRPPPPRRRAPSTAPPMRPPAMTQAGLGPGPPSSLGPGGDALANTSSLPQLEPAPRPSLVRPPEPTLAQPSSPPPAPRVEPEVVRPPRASTEVVEMLWYDEEATPRLRQCFRSLCEELDFAPRDDRHDLPEGDPKRARDHHTHFGVLTQAPLSDHALLRRSLRDAVSDTGRFTPPLVALRGTLRLTFDEVEILRVTAAVAKPIAGDDKKLKATLEQIAELEDSPLLRGSSETVKRFTDQLRKQYREGRRALSVDYLEDTVERALLEERRYARRKLFGGEVLRAVVSLGDTRHLPCYLPASLTDKLPMLIGFSARLVAELHAKQDQYEPSPHALRAVTLGRVIDVGD